MNGSLIGAQTRLFRAHSDSVSLRGFNREGRLSRERQQIPVAGDQNICPSAVRQVQKRLIIQIAAFHRASPAWLNNLANREIVGEHFLLLVLRHLEFEIREHSHQFRRCLAREKWHAFTV